MESSEKTTDRENYLTAYIQKHETMLLDLLRKNIDLEIKLVAYTTSYNELIEQLESIKKELAVQTDLVNQATNGLQTVTFEKNQLAGREEGYNSRIRELELKVRELEGALVQKTNEHVKSIADLENYRKNVVSSSKETDEIRRELQLRNEELNNLYRENEELKAKLPPQPKKATKKPTEVILPTDEF